MSIEPISDEGAGALPPSGYTCPECHGALWPLLEDQTALRCRVGHTWGPESLAEAQTTQVEAALWAAMRALEEQAELVKTLAQRAEDRGDSRTAARFHQRWEAAHVQARVIGDLVRQGVAPPAAAADS